MKFALFGHELKIERKSLADPTETECAIFGATSTAPIHITPVANAVRLLSEGAATLDLDVVKRGPVPEQVNHPALALLTGEANPWTSGYELRRDLLSTACIYDAGGIAIAVRNSEGKVVEIIQYDPGRITFQRAADGSGEPTYSMDGRQLNPRDVIHVRSPFSRSPVNLARNAIDTAAAMETHAKRQFERGAKPGAVVEVPKGIGEDAIKRMRASFGAAYEGSANAGRTAFLYDGVTFKIAQLSSVDAQFLELRRFQVEEIARAFNMSASMLGDLTRSSFANSEQKAKEFLSYALEPWLCAMESAFNRVLLTDEERATFAFRHDRDDLSRVDLATRANAINSLIASEVINPNTGAAWIGQPPHDGGETFGNRNITVKPIQTNEGLPNGK